MLIPDHWVVFAEPRHYILSQRCCFGISTWVPGLYVVSSVGCCHTRRDEDRSLGNIETVGYQRHFESMVFECDDGGKPRTFGELDTSGVLIPDPITSESLVTAKRQAMSNHWSMCRTWLR